MTNNGAVYGKAADWLFSTLENVRADVLLTSPYVSFDVCLRLERLAKDSNFRWKIVTCLDPIAVANGYLRTDGLERLLNAGVEILHVDRLHAKAFIVGDQGCVGSANLTGAGLGTVAAPNMELGVALDGPQVELMVGAIQAWSTREVTVEDLKLVREKARAISKESPAVGHVTGKFDGLSALEQLLLDARDADRAFWLKSEYGSPELEQWQQESLFGNPKKGKPTIASGDFVIICAENKDCYAVVEVTSSPEYLPKDYVLLRGEEDAERWPWVSRTTPRFAPDKLLGLKATEILEKTNGLQNGYMRLSFEQFTNAVRSLSRLIS